LKSGSNGRFAPAHSARVGREPDRKRSGHDCLNVANFGFVAAFIHIAIKENMGKPALAEI
jgi:hypothetical protein